MSKVADKLCACGQLKLQGRRLCRECWFAAPADLRRDLRYGRALDVRRAALRGLIEFALTRRQTELITA